MRPIRTSVDMLRHIEETYSNPTALNWRDNEKWHSISTQELLNTIKFLALGLHELGVNKGNCVGLMANSSPFWTMADLAIIMAGGVTVPLFANIADENLVYEVTQTNLKIIFIEGDDQKKTVEKHKNLFELAIVIGEDTAPANATTFQQVLKCRKGRSYGYKEFYAYYS